MGGETSVETEHFVLDDCCDWEVVEQVCVVFPDVCIFVSSIAFIVEAIDLGDLTALVIAS